MSKETDPKGTRRKARRQGVDGKGLEDERRGRESKGQERSRVVFWGKSPEKQMGESRGCGGGGELQTQEKGVGEAKGKGARASVLLREGKIIAPYFAMRSNADDAWGCSPTRCTCNGDTVHQGRVCVCVSDRAAPSFLQAVI